MGIEMELLEYKSYLRPQFGEVGRFIMYRGVVDNDLALLDFFKPVDASDQS